MKIFINVCLLFFSITIQAQSKDLNYYISQAKINSPLINKSMNNNKILQLDLQQVKSLLSKPKVDVNALVLFAPIISHDNNSNKFEWVSKAADDYTGYDLSYSDGGQYQAFLSITQPLFTRSIYDTYAKKAEVAQKINENNIELNNHELEQLISYQYLICLKSKKQREISLKLINDLKKQLEILENLVKNAIYKQTDLLLLQIELQNFELETKTFASEYRNNLSDLNLLCGIKDTNLIDILDIEFELKADTLSNSRFLTSYKLDSLNIMAEQMLFEQKYKARVNLFANAGMAAIYLPEFNRLGFSTGISLSWNIFDGHQRKAESEKSMIKLQNLAFEKQNFMAKHQVNKNKYLSQIKLVEQQSLMVEKQLNQYRKLMDLYQIEFSQSQVSIMDFKIVIKDISLKNQELLLLKMKKQVLISFYNFWEY